MDWNLKKDEKTDACSSEANSMQMLCPGISKFIHQNFIFDLLVIANDNQPHQTSYIT